MPVGRVVTVLWDLCEEGKIKPRDAYMKASDKPRFERLLDSGG